MPAHVAPRLLGASHYYQAPNIHPVRQMIPEGRVRIELVTAGRGWVEHQGKWVEVTAGTLLWQAPGDSTIGRSDFADPYRCLAAHFEVTARSPRPAPRITEWQDLEAVHAFTAEVVRRFVHDAFARDVLSEYVWATLRYRAELSALRTQTAPLPEPLRRALQLIEESYQSKITLEALARHAGWSAPHLNETCRVHLKKTLHQILIARRLRAAREQLVGTDKPIKAIALDCGFAHAAALCEAFRSAFEMTPGEYRVQFQTVAGAGKRR